MVIWDLFFDKLLFPGVAVVINCHVVSVSSFVLISELICYIANYKLKFLPFLLVIFISHLRLLFVFRDINLRKLKLTKASH